MNPFNLIPEPYRLLGTIAVVAFAATAIIGGAFYIKHTYDDGKRAEGAAPYVAAIAKQNQEAAALLAAETAKVRATEADRDKRISTLTGAYSDERIKTERDFNDLRVAHGRLRDADARCGSGDNRAAGFKAENAGSAQGNSGGGEISARLDGLLWNLIRDTKTTIRQYELCQAYAREVSAPE